MLFLIYRIMCLCRLCLQWFSSPYLHDVKFSVCRDSCRTRGLGFSVEGDRLVWLQTVHRSRFSFNGHRLYEKSVSANKKKLFRKACYYWTCLHRQFSPCVFCASYRSPSTKFGVAYGLFKCLLHLRRCLTSGNQSMLSVVDHGGEDF